MIDVFQYGFMVRSFEAGIIIGIIAPLIGIFLVLRRYSLIADTLSHVSLVGIALALLLKIDPVITATVTSTISSIFIEKLRTSKRIYGESTLALYLSGSLGLAVVLMSLTQGLGTNLSNFLFGSIVTVKQTDIVVMGSVGLLTILVIYMFFKEFMYVTFDEDAARVSGVPVATINTLLIVLTAFTVSLAIPIVGVLLVSSLVVIPVLAALQLKTSFRKTLIAAEIISIGSVITGIWVSFYLNISTGGTIVLMTLLVFFLFYGLRRIQ